MGKPRYESPYMDRMAMLDDPVSFVWVFFCQTNDIMLRARDLELGLIGTSHEYAATLHLIDFLGKEATPAEIARRRLRRPHTISDLLISMEKEGLVQRNNDLKRRNQVRITLTEHGYNIYRASLKGSSIRRMFSCLTHEEQEQVSRFFWRMQRRAIMELSGIYQEGPTSEEMVARSPEENLWRLLRRTNDIMVRVREKELSQYGLSIKMASALRVINMLGDRATPAAIARGRFRRPSTVSNLLMRMEKMGLIQKVPDRVKKNQIQVTLTEKGRRAYQQSREDTSVHRMFADLSTEDVKQFGAYLDELKIMAVREFDSHE